MAGQTKKVICIFQIQINNHALLSSERRLNRSTSSGGSRSETGRVSVLETQCNQKYILQEIFFLSHLPEESIDSDRPRALKSTGVTGFSQKPCLWRLSCQNLRNSQSNKAFYMNSRAFNNFVSKFVLLFSHSPRSETSSRCCLFICSSESSCKSGAPHLGTCRDDFLMKVERYTLHQTSEDTEVIVFTNKEKLLRKLKIHMRVWDTVR